MLKLGFLTRVSFTMLISLLLLAFLVIPGFAADNGNKVSTLAKPVGDDEIDVNEGRLVKVTHNALELDIEGNIKTFHLTNKSTFWRGEETDVSSFQPGDSVMVRFNKNFIVDYAWANLTRVQGLIQHDMDNGYRILVAGLENPGINIIVDKQRTVFENTVSNNKEWAGTRLPEGAFIDVIGLRLEDGSILGTLIYYVEPGLDLVKTEKSPKENNSISPLATYGYYGYASWFDCPTGAGRCGTCNTSRSDQAAWPAMDSSCSDCSYYCCNCSRGCKNQVYLSCGASVSVYDFCEDRWMTVNIADCGPHQIDLCSRTCADCLGYQTPVIDLTKPTFARFYNPAYRGCFSAYAETIL